MGALRTAARRVLKRDDLRRQFPQCSFAEGVIVKGRHGFFPGKRCFIDVRAYLNCAGGAWNQYKGYIRMGDDCEIGPYSVLWGAGGITMGKNVHIGALVSISAHERLNSSRDEEAPGVMRFAPVVIEDDVMIGSNSTIAPGVRIGHHARIGVGTAVIRDIETPAPLDGLARRV